MMAVMPTMDALSGISKEELDALSSDDDDSDSDDEDDHFQKHAVPKNQVKDFEGFEEGYDENDPIAKQMETIISLKVSLGIDNDKEFLAEHERKKKEREEKEKEAARIAAMTPEERIQYESEQASSLFASAAQRVMEQKKEYAWEKPDWAKKSKLRTTAAGEAVKKGVDLQAPITMAPHMKQEPELSPRKVIKEKLRHRSEAGVVEKKEIGWEKPDWAKQTKLKSTAAGQAVKKGVDLQAPITQAPHIKKVSPGEAPGLIPLKTLKGRQNSEPLPKKEIGWEKPDWTKKPKLRTTSAGEAVKKGVDLQGPITLAPHIKKGTPGSMPGLVRPGVGKVKSPEVGAMPSLVRPGVGKGASRIGGDSLDSASMHSEAPPMSPRKARITRDPLSAASEHVPGSPRRAILTKEGSLPGSPNKVKRGVVLAQPPTTPQTPVKDETKAEVMNLLRQGMKAAKSKRCVLAESPTKSPTKAPVSGKATGAEAEVMSLLKAGMKKAKSKRNLVVED